MATMLETPSRIWRRIEAIEDNDMPSLPSVSPFEDSVDAETAVSLSLSNSSRGISTTRRSQHDSFEVPSLSRIQQASVTDHYQEDDDEESKSSVPDVYLPPPDDLEEDDGDPLELISQIGSPIFSPETMEHQETPKSNYDRSISLNSEPKVRTNSHIKWKLINRLG